MPVVPSNSLQERIRKVTYAQKQPALLSLNRLQVIILEAYDVDKLNQDGIPDELAPLLVNEPGTLFAKVRSIKTNRLFFVGFKASEVEIFSQHGNCVLLRGLRGTIEYNGFRPEEGRLVLRGEPSRPLAGSDSTIVFDISGIA